MKRDYPKAPIVAVGVVVLRAQNVLLIKRAKPPKPDEWSLPGGAQDLGETLQDAGIREVKEECGLDVSIGGLVDVVDFIDRDAKGDARFHYSLIDYWAVSNSAEPVPGDDASQAQWVPLCDIDAMPLWDETKRVIHSAAQLRDKALHDR